MRRLIMIATVGFATFALGACGGAPDANEGQASDAVAGVSDIAGVAKSLGLEAGNPALLRLEEGACHRALRAKLKSSDLPYGTFSFDSYANGAVFFDARGDAKEQVLRCVDLHLTNGQAASLSGVSLDAALRFSLGKPLRVDSSTGGASELVFERGALQFTSSSNAEELATRAMSRPTLTEIDEAPTVMGKLEQVIVSEIQTSVMGGADVMGHAIPGWVAFFAFRFSWREHEDRGTYTLEGDRLGALLDDEAHTRSVVQLSGDGPGWISRYSMQRGELIEGGVSFSPDYGADFEGAEHYVRIRRPGAASGGNDVPLAECTRTMKWDDLRGEEVPLTPWRCTGL